MGYGVLIWTAVTVIIVMLWLTFVDVLNKKMIVQIKIQAFGNDTEVLLFYNSWECF